jgi:hypothetical protein
MTVLGRCTLVAAWLVVPWLVVPRLAMSQSPDRVPPEPAQDAELPVLAAWIEQWLPVIGVARYDAVDSTADFYAHGSDSVTAARLDGCTLILHEQVSSTVRGARSVRHLAIHIPLEAIDTSRAQPKIRQARLLLSRPNVLLFGQLVVPLRNRAGTEFITVFTEDDPGPPTLVGEHQVPSVFAEVPAARSALVIRRAAARCQPAAP